MEPLSYAFVIANTLSSMPYMALVATISWTITYYMVKLHPRFAHCLYFVLNLFSCMAIVESLMMTVATLVLNLLMGIITGAGILGIFMLVVGFLCFLKDLPKPVWHYPMSYISFNSWALQGKYKNDLIGLDFKPQTVGMPKISSDYILENVFEINTKRSKWVDLIIIISMIFIYRMMFFLLIKYNEKVGHSLQARFAKHKMRSMGKQASMNSIRSVTPTSHSGEAKSSPS